MQNFNRVMTRFDPSEFSPGEAESVRHLLDLFRNETNPPALVDEHGGVTPEVGQIKTEVPQVGFVLGLDWIAG